jgi:hypothetical protein
MIFLKSKLKVPEDTNFTDTLGLDVWPSDLWGNTFLLFRSLSLWDFVLAAQPNEYASVYICHGGLLGMI